MLEINSTDISSIDAPRALKILCLYLAQKPEPSEPHVELGFATCKSAFEELGKKFARPPNTVKNYRDHFDAFTDSRRAGWHQRELSIVDKEILQQYSTVPRNIFLETAKNILQKNWSVVGTNEISEIFDYTNLIDLNPLKPQDNLVTNPVIGDFALPEKLFYFWKKI